MADYNQYYLLTKDGAINGYFSLLVVVPEVKMGLFMTISTGGYKCVCPHILQLDTLDQ